MFSKRKLWGDNKEIIDEYKQEPFLLMGDFNCICSKEGIENCVFRDMDSWEFKDFISINKLWDIPLQGHKFTWSWPSGNFWLLEGDCRKASDHIPLILRKESKNWGSVPFKAFNFWLENEDFKEWIHKELRNGVSPNHLHANFGSWRLLRFLIKKWSSCYKQDVDKHIEWLEENLDSRDR